MESKSEISILVTAYNAEKYIGRCLDSLISQTSPPKEIVVVDDGSTDQTRLVLAKYTRRYMVIKPFYRPHLGRISALNYGLQKATGKYVALADADDISLADRLAKQLSVIGAEPRVTVVLGGYEVIDEGGRVLSRKTIIPDDAFIKRALCVFNPIGNGGTLFKRSDAVSIGGYRDYQYVEDYDFYVRLSELPNTVFGFSGIVYQYRDNPDGVSRSFDDIQRDNLNRLLNLRWSTHRPEVWTRKMFRQCYSKLTKHQKNEYLSVNLSVIYKRLKHHSTREGLAEWLRLLSLSFCTFYKVIAHTVKALIVTTLQKIS